VCQQTEQRMGKRKWQRMLADLQKKARCAKATGPDARERLMESLATIIYVVQRTKRGSLVRWPRRFKLVPSITWTAARQGEAARHNR
jgi:hypothetical protein